MAMTNAEFATAVNDKLDRIIEVKGTLQLGALLFSTEYSPENFAKKMNLPGNSMQGIDRRKTGLNSYEYFCNTLTGGYIHCTVIDPIQGQTGSGSMGFENISAWFQQHKTTQKFVKGTIFASLGVLVALNLEIVDAVEQAIRGALPDWLPLWWLVKPGIIGAFLGLDNWLKHNTTLPVVGAGKK